LVEAHYLAVGAGEAQKSVRPHKLAGARDVDCLRRKEGSRYQLAGIDPAASTNGFPKASRPSRECALRTTAAGGLACLGQ
jgi:hypothetical protein